MSDEAFLLTPHCPPRASKSGDNWPVSAALGVTAHCDVKKPLSFAFHTIGVITCPSQPSGAVRNEIILLI